MLSLSAEDYSKYFPAHIINKIIFLLPLSLFYVCCKSVCLKKSLSKSTHLFVYLATHVSLQILKVLTKYNRTQNSFVNEKSKKHA